MSSTANPSHTSGLVTDFPNDLKALLEQYRQLALFDVPHRRLTVQERLNSLKSGEVLCEPESVIINHEVCTRFAIDLIRLFRSAMPADAEGFTYIKNTFISGQMNGADFLHHVFCDRGSDFAKVTQRLGLRRDLVELFAVYFARPFLANTARILTEGIDLSLWQKGLCPVCGQLPALTRMIDRHDPSRDLWCVHCETIWSVPASRCPFCSEETLQSLELFISGYSDLARIQVCGKCSHYLKETKSYSMSMDSEFFRTRAMDAPIQSHGYILEPLFRQRFSNLNHAKAI